MPSTWDEAMRHVVLHAGAKPSRGQLDGTPEVRKQVTEAFKGSRAKSMYQIMPLKEEGSSGPDPRSDMTASIAVYCLASDDKMDHRDAG